jgi:hypothetical protein
MSQTKLETHESWNCLDIFFCYNGRVWFHSLVLQLQALLAAAGLACTISTSLMVDDFDCLLAPVTASLLSPFLFTKFDNFNCWDVFTCRISVWRRSWADNMRMWQKIIWYCCQNDRLFQNKWPKRPTHAADASDTWSSILQFVHDLFWLKLKWNARSKLFYFIIYRSSMLWWSSRTLAKLKSQSQKRFNERKYQ